MVFIAARLSLVRHAMRRRIRKGLVLRHPVAQHVQQRLVEHHASAAD